MKKILLTIALVSLLSGTIFAVTGSFKEIHDDAIASIKIDQDKLDTYKDNYENYLKKAEQDKKKGNTKSANLNSKGASSAYKVVDSLNDIIKYKKSFLKYQAKIQEAGVAFSGKDMGTEVMFKIPKGMKPSTRIANLNKCSEMYSDQAKTAKIKDSGSHLAVDYQNLAKTTKSIADSIESYDKAMSKYKKSVAELNN